ncbi:hypothetical protein ZWY2020_026590 [Hordeum vulgare]|nr:hypothetical protein ZWY2020_026590 [Hordeum vulgare]
MVDLASELTGKLEALHSPQAQVGDRLPPPCSIIVGKVRDQTRNVDKDEYDPDHVAIGPYNYPHRNLTMEHDKLVSLEMVLKAAKARRHGMPVEVNDYIHELKCLEESVRKCYGNPFPGISSEQFVRMLLLDGCYILSCLVDGQLRAQPMDDAAAGTVNAGVLPANGAVAPATANAVVLAANGAEAPVTADAGVLPANGAEAPATADAGVLAANGAEAPATADAGVLAANGAEAPAIANAGVLAANGAEAPATADGGVLAANGAEEVGTTNADAGVVSAQRADALTVLRDVFYLAENQIPFFVLEKIGELTGLEGNDSVFREAQKYSLKLMRAQKYAMAAPASEPAVPGNLLHLLHMYLKPARSISPAAPVSGTVRRWRSATDYYFAGVAFKRREMSETWCSRTGVMLAPRCILDVKLSSGGGTLEVPVLDIDAETWRLLRNLMELEQRNRETVGSDVTAYCVFISQVACTSKDVELLTKRGVIVHGQGNNDEVAKCFADLCKGIIFDPDDPDCNYLRETCKKLEKRFHSHRQRWMAWLRRNYFSNPWLAAGLLAAVIGLVCAIMQAVYSVLSYKHG